MSKSPNSMMEWSEDAMRTINDLQAQNQKLISMVEEANEQTRNALKLAENVKEQLDKELLKTKLLEKYITKNSR